VSKLQLRNESVRSSKRDGAQLSARQRYSNINICTCACNDCSIPQGFNYYRWCL